jgi:hypothetical protein
MPAVVPFDVLTTCIGFVHPGLAVDVFSRRIVACFEGGDGRPVAAGNRTPRGNRPSVPGVSAIRWLSVRCRAWVDAVVHG